MLTLSDDFKKIISALNYWKIYLNRPDRDFISRFKIQKLTYLCKSMGMPLNYNFTLYINGPYSTSLTRDYFEEPQLIETLQTDYILNEKDIEILDKINEYVLVHPISTEFEAEFLEAISTAYYIRNKSSSILDDEIFAKVKEVKPHIKDSIIVVAINTVKKLFFKPEILNKEVKREIEIWDKAKD